MRIEPLQYGAADKVCCLEYHMVGAGAETVLGGEEGESVQQQEGACVPGNTVVTVQRRARYFAAVPINILCPFLQLSSGLNLFACICWGGIPPRSLRHTQRARQNGRSDHILKYPPRLMAAMGITSRSRGSSPGSCAELEPGAACYGYSCSRFSHFAHNSRSFWQESVS